MFEDATVMATEDETIMININTNILVDSIPLNAVDGTATLNGKPFKSASLFDAIIKCTNFIHNIVDYSFPMPAAFPTGGKYNNYTPD